MMIKPGPTSIRFISASQPGKDVSVVMIYRFFEPIFKPPSFNHPPLEAPLGFVLQQNSTGVQTNIVCEHGLLRLWNATARAGLHLALLHYGPLGQSGPSLSRAEHMRAVRAERHSGSL